MLSLPKSSVQINAGEPTLEIVTLQCWAAIAQVNAVPQLFLHDGRMVLLQDGHDGGPHLEPLGVDLALHILARVARWYRIEYNDQNQPEKVDSRPTREIVRDWLATPDPPLPVLQSVARVPICSKTRELILNPGFHDSEHLLYVPETGLSIPAIATSLAELRAEAEGALDFLKSDLLPDFPFVTESDRCHAICALLLPFARNVIDGPTPLHLISKPTPGTGGSLLAELIALPAVGARLASSSAPRDEAEWNRTITALLRDAPLVVFSTTSMGDWTVQLWRQC